MYTSRFIGASWTLPNRSSTSLTFNPNSHSLPFLKNKDFASCSYHGSVSRSLRYDPMFMMERPNFVVRNNITPPPGVPLPSGSPSGSMRNWILGILVTFVLPCITHKWGPLTVLKNRVDTVVDTAEHIMETIEDVAERVDKVIDNITDELPENSKIRITMEAIDGLVEGLAKSAHIANDIIDKVEEVEDKLESLIIHEAREKEEVSMQVAEKLEVSMQVTEKGEVSMQVAEKEEISMQATENEEVSMQVAEKLEVSMQVVEKENVSMQVAEKEDVSIYVTETKEVSMQVAEKEEVIVRTKN